MEAARHTRSANGPCRVLGLSPKSCFIRIVQQTASAGFSGCRPNPVLLGLSNKRLPPGFRVVAQIMLTDKCTMRPEPSFFDCRPCLLLAPSLPPARCRHLPSHPPGAASPKRPTTTRQCGQAACRFSGAVARWDTSSPLPIFCREGWSPSRCWKLQVSAV